jgi:hypothetical protein
MTSKSTKIKRQATPCRRSGRYIKSDWKNTIKGSKRKEYDLMKDLNRFLRLPADDGSRVALPENYSYARGGNLWKKTNVVELFFPQGGY